MISGFTASAGPILPFRSRGSAVLYAKNLGARNGLLSAPNTIAVLGDRRYSCILTYPMVNYHHLLLKHPRGLHVVDPVLHQLPYTRPSF